MTNFRVVYSDSLQHHGIPGQKWGQKNGPPYPLDKSDYSAAERKAVTGSTSNEGTSKSGKTFNKETAKKIAIGVGVTTAVAGGIYLAVKNKDAVNAFVKAHGNMSMSEFKKAKSAVINRGKSTVEDVMNATKDYAKAKKIESNAEWTRKYYGKDSNFVGPMKEVPKDVLRSFKTKEMTKDVLTKVAPGTWDNFVNGVKDGKNKSVKAIGTGLAMLGIKECTDIVLGKNNSGKLYKANDKDAIGKFWRYEEQNESKK